jgi:hypothetical protein
MKNLIAILLMAISPGIAAAQVNKCLDASGKVVGYASECPPGTRSEQTNIRSAPGSTTAPAQKSLAERDADFRKRQMEKQEASAKAEKKAAEAANTQRACEDARSYLKALQERQRIARTNPKTGEQTVLSEADYAKEIATTQRSVAEYCK